MKKLYLLTALLATAFTSVAAELPEPTVRPLPSKYDWFDGFVAVWADKITEPYTLQIVSTSDITVTKNQVEDLKVSHVYLVEYQEDEETPNYEDSQLVIGLEMLEMEVGAYYTLHIPAGAINVIMSETETVPCQNVDYTFQLEDGHNEPYLSEPEVEPEPGVVASLNQIKMTWTGKLGIYDLLNAVNDLLPYDWNQEDPQEKEIIDPITLTDADGVSIEPEYSFEWSSKEAFTEGAAGDILVLTLTEEETLADGNYELYIPAGFLQISDIETGTSYNDEIIINYTVDSSIGGIEIVITDKNSNTIYDLNGRTQNPKDLRKGIYIINGKKIAL